MTIDRKPVPADEALDRLREGNHRFVTGTIIGDRALSHAERAEMAKQQQPFAIILGCSDSRVPAEMVFDQGLGDLFMIRVAGNIVAPSQIGSVEFAASQFNTQLVIVLGHSHCGAIIASLDELEQHTNSQSANVRSIVDRVRQCIEPLLAGEGAQDRASLVRKAVKANVQASVDHLRNGSELLKALMDAGTLRIIGAEYSLETGKVDFYDDDKS